MECFKHITSYGKIKMKQMVPSILTKVKEPRILTKVKDMRRAHSRPEFKGAKNFKFSTKKDSTTMISQQAIVAKFSDQK